MKPLISSFIKVTHDGSEILLLSLCCDKLWSNYFSMCVVWKHKTPRSHPSNQSWQFVSIASWPVQFNRGTILLHRDKDKHTCVVQCFNLSLNMPRMCRAKGRVDASLNFTHLPHLQILNKSFYSNSSFIIYSFGNFFPMTGLLMRKLIRGTICSLTSQRCSLVSRLTLTFSMM